MQSSSHASGTVEKLFWVHGGGGGGDDDDEDENITKQYQTMNESAIASVYYPESQIGTLGFLQTALFHLLDTPNFPRSRTFLLAWHRSLAQSGTFDQF